MSSNDELYQGSYQALHCLWDDKVKVGIEGSNHNFKLPQLSSEIGIYSCLPIQPT